MKKKMTGLGVLGLTAFGILAATAMAFPGWNKEAVRAALEEEDYEQWKSLMEKHGSVLPQIVQENEFPLLIEHHMQIKIRREEHRQKHQQMRQAIEAGDFEAWKNAIGADSHLEPTEENFAKFIELHQAKKERDFERTRELIETEEVFDIFRSASISRGNY